MPSQTLKRQLTLLPAVMIVISAVIGSGIFTVPGEIMAKAQGSGPNFLAWVIAGICAFMMANIYIELAPAMPQAGGAYVYLRKAFGDKVSFFYGWSKMLDETSVMALFAIFVMNNVRIFWPAMPDLAAKSIGTLLLVASALICIRGTKQNAGVTTGFTIAKLVALGMIVVGGVFVFKAINFQPVADPTAGSLGGWSTSFPAAVLACFAFGGYYQLCDMSEEIKDPKRTLPRALLLGIGVITLFYMLITLVCVGTLGVDALGKSSAPVTDVATKIFGSAGGAIVAVCIIISIIGALSALQMGAPRVGFAMGRDGVFLRSFATLHKRYGTPWVSIASYTGVGIIFLWTGQFGTLLMMNVFFGRFMDLLIAVSLWWLRRKQPDMERPLKMWGYPVTLILTILLTAFLASQIDPMQIVWALVLCAIAVPVYFLAWLWNKHRGTDAPLVLTSDTPQPTEASV